MRYNQLYTIGYAGFSIDGFITLLKSQQIKAVADVRSQPYSKFAPEFNKEVLTPSLKVHDISYVFLGEELGARRSEPECYVNGKVVYSRVELTERFQSGVNRLLKGLTEMSIALMCAEKDPATCHRFALICHHMKNYDLEIKHFYRGSIESNPETEKRLLKSLKMTNMDLFRSDSQVLEDAYQRLSEKISYSVQQESDGLS